MKRTDENTESYAAVGGDEQTFYTPAALAPGSQCMRHAALDQN
jgi:hypothetical protein